jgi:DNA-binding SARP family transcriptional activator
MMEEEYHSPYPLFRVTTFGRFIVEQLVFVSPEQSPCYEPIAEQIWRSRFAACDLLKFLLCRTQRRAPKDVLIEALWPDVEMASASHSFDSAISRLRSILTSQGKESLLVTKRVSSTVFYELPSQQILWTDVDAFLALLTQAEQTISQGHDALPLLEAAWHYATGVFLEDNVYSPWAQARRQTINVTRHRVLRQLVDLYIQRGRADQAETLLLSALEEEPTDEDSVCCLMTLLELQGRRQEALRCYERLVMILKEEGEAEPSPPTQALAEHLRTTPIVSSSAALLEGSIDIHVTATQRGMSRPALFTVTVPLTTPTIPQQLFIPLSQRDNGEFSLEEHTSPRVAAPQEGLSSDLLLYRIIKEICYWMGREGFQNSLPIIIDRLIKEFDTMEQQRMPAESVLSRRDALLVIAGLPLTLLTRIQTDSLTAMLLEEFLAQCAASIATCWHLLKGTEFQQVGSLLLRYLPELEKQAYQPSKYQKYSASLAAQGHLLSATLALHQNNLLAREVHCKQAVRLGQIAEDVNLHMTSLKWLAVTYYYVKRPSKALQVYQEIEPFLGQVSPLLRGSVYIKMAGTYAQCGKEQDALRFIQMAHESFPEHPEQDPCFLYADCGLPTLPIWEGLAYLDLGKSQAAWSALERVEQLATTVVVSERARVEATNHQAEAAIGLDDQERFRTYIEMGTTGAIVLGSEKRYNEALDVYKQARLVWSKEPRIKELQDLFVR